MISKDLIAAYESADYVIFAEPELVLKIGEPSARLEGIATPVYAARQAILKEKVPA